MHLILVGCEYAGKTTIANEIVGWIGRTMGTSRGFHDHFTIPTTEWELEDQEYFLKASPRIKEQFQRYVMEYHLQDSFYQDADHNMVGFHIEEAVYAPLYYGYGGKGQYSERSALARAMEVEILKRAPDTALVLLKASPEVIRQRMRLSAPPGVVRKEVQVRGPNTKTETKITRGVLQDKDVEYVLKRFDEEFADSLLRVKIALDTSKATVQETLAEFVQKIKPHITEADRLRILSHASIN